MISKVKGIFLIIMISLLCVGCASSSAVKEEEEQTEHKIQIGMSFDSFVIERWQRDRDVFVSSVQDQGAEVIVQTADGSIDEQIEQIKYFINKKVDAIVIVAVDCSALGDVVKQAKDAGIYVISYDRMLLDADIDFVVTFDNRRVGELMAQNLCDNIKERGRILCINGSEQDNNVSEVQEGFHSIIDDSGRIIIYNEYCENWEAEKAYDMMQGILNSNVQFDAIMCGNDDIATMVYKALSERGKMDNVIIVGQDADLAACQRIVNGWQSMTVYKSVEKLAKEAAQDTLELINTGEIQTDIKLDNGYKTVPAVLLEPIEVTKDNMDEVIIDGGFHLYDEVYDEQ